MQLHSRKDNPMAKNLALILGLAVGVIAGWFLYTTVRGYLTDAKNAQG